MRSFPLPFNEPDRLAAAETLAGIAPDSHPVLNEIAAMVRATLDVPTALVSIVDDSKQWFAAREGFSVSETPKDFSICAHTVMDPAVLVVCDTHADPRFRTHPAVVNDPHIRHYVGAPITLSTGHRVGSLCAIDYVARDRPSKAALATLEGLARIAARTLESAASATPATDKGASPIGAAKGAPTPGRVRSDCPQQAKATFIALIGHELRTPLTVTKGSLSLLSRASTPQMREKLTQSALRATDHLHRVVETLIDFADATTGELVLNEAPQDLAALVDEVAQMTLEAKDGSARRIARAPQNGPLPALVDATQIRLALENLALNAAQHGGTEITLGCGRDAEGNIELWVKDSNSACETTLQALVAPFAVGGAIAQRGTGGGLGLGLPLTRKLAELHAGTVEITSRDGATLACIRLPSWRAELAGAPFGSATEHRAPA